MYYHLTQTPQLGLHHTATSLCDTNKSLHNRNFWRMIDTYICRLVYTAQYSACVYYCIHAPVARGRCAGRARSPDCCVQCAGVAAPAPANNNFDQHDVIPSLLAGKLPHVGVHVVAMCTGDQYTTPPCSWRSHTYDRDAKTFVTQRLNAKGTFKDRVVVNKTNQRRGCIYTYRAIRVENRQSQSGCHVCTTSRVSHEKNLARAGSISSSLYCSQPNLTPYFGHHRPVKHPLAPSQAGHFHFCARCRRGASWHQEQMDCSGMDTGPANERP